jgi:hypothetical protein
VIAPAGLMLMGWIIDKCLETEGESNVVKVPLRDRTKP